MSERLPIEPLREYLIRLKESNGWGWHEVSLHLGIDGRAIRRWMTESNNVNIDAIDQCFINIGEPGLLNELWPLEEYVP